MIENRGRGIGATAWVCALVWGGLAFCAATPGRSAPRAMSLDQCADQYVLALASRDAIVGVSPRVGDRDSYLRAASVGLPRRRASSEAILAARPDVVVRSWGGDPKLLRALAARRIGVVSIAEAGDFDGVRGNIRTVAQALDARPRGEALIARLDRQLNDARGAWDGREALYLTPSAFTAGPGTLIDAVLRAVGLRNAARGDAFHPVSLERLVLNPPDALVLSFFDRYGVAQQQWGVGRNPVLRSLVKHRAVATLPASVVGCPAWFAGDAVQTLGASRGQK